MTKKQLRRLIREELLKEGRISDITRREIHNAQKILISLINGLYDMDDPEAKEVSKLIDKANDILSKAKKTSEKLK